MLLQPLDLHGRGALHRFARRKAGTLQARTGTEKVSPSPRRLLVLTTSGVPPDIILEQIADFKTGLWPLLVHRVENGPVIINDAVKAPYHSVYLTFDMWRDSKRRGSA